MSIKPDHWIARMAREHGMIEPFEPQQVRAAPSGERVVSYGLSSYGYDIRVADEFKIFTPNPYNTVVDPKAIDPRAFHDFQGDVCIVPPNSYALCRSLEYFRIPPDVLVVVLGKCLSGDTRIVDANSGAYLPLRDFAGAGKTIGFADGRLQALAASDVIPQGKKQVYRLTTRTGREIWATANHPFKTVLGWVPLSELISGSRIAVARNIPIFGTTPLPEWEAALLGLMIAEGQCDTPGHSPTFTSDDPVLVSLFTSCVKVGLGCEVTYRGRYGYRLVNQVGRGGIMRRNRGTDWLRGYGLNVGSAEKFVPQAIFTAPQPVVTTFLRALFSGDGTIYSQKSSSSLTLEYCSTSRRLIDDVHHLLLRFGIFSSIRAKQPKRGRLAYILTVYNRNDIDRFAKRIGFWPGSVKQTRLAEFCATHLLSWDHQRSKNDHLPPEAWEVARAGMQQ